MGIKKWIPFLISVAILTLLIATSDYKSVINTLRNANLRVILIGIVLWTFGAVLRTERWRYLLRKINISVPFPTAFRVYVSSMFISNTTPAKTGDPIRSVFLKNAAGPAFSSTISSVVIERVVEISMMVSIVLAGVFLLPKTDFTRLIFTISGIYVLGVLAILYIISSERRATTLAKMMHRLLYFMPKIRKMENRLTSSAKMISDSTRKYGKSDIIITTLLMTGLIWTIEYLTVFLGFQAVGVTVPIWIIIFVLPITLLISIATLLPGGLGAGEAINVILYGAIAGIEPHTILAAALVWRLMSYWTYVIVGSALLSTSSIKRT